jgi:hypothetical protein
MAGGETSLEPKGQPKQQSLEHFTNESQTKHGRAPVWPLPPTLRAGRMCSRVRGIGGGGEVSEYEHKHNLHNAQQSTPLPLHSSAACCMMLCAPNKPVCRQVMGASAPAPAPE